MLRRGKREQAEPRFPFWKDEKFLGVISSRNIIAALLIGLIIFVVLAVIIYFRFASYISQAHNDRIENQQDNQQIQEDTQDQLDIVKNQLRDVVCSTLVGLPADNPIARSLREQFPSFNCPPSGAHFTPAPGDFPTSTPSPHPSNSIHPSSVQSMPSPTTITLTSSQTAHATVTLRVPQPTRVETNTVTISVHPSKTPTRTKTVTVTASSTTILCEILGVLRLCP